MKTLIMLFLAAALMLAADPVKPAAAPDLSVKLAAAEQAARLSELKAMIYQERAVGQQLEKLRADQQALYLETCKAAGIEADPKVCAIDLDAKTVTKRVQESAAPKPETKQ